MSENSVGLSYYMKEGLNMLCQTFRKSKMKPSSILPLLLLLFTISSASAAELLPFPSREQQPQRSNPAPIYQTKVKEEICNLACPDLIFLKQQIFNRMQSATTAQESEYYSVYLAEINNTMQAKNCTQ